MAKVLMNSSKQVRPLFLTRLIQALIFDFAMAFEIFLIKDGSQLELQKHMPSSVGVKMKRECATLFVLPVSNPIAFFRNAHKLPFRCEYTSWVNSPFSRFSSCLRKLSSPSRYLRSRENGQSPVGPTGLLLGPASVKPFIHIRTHRVDSFE